MRNEEAEGDVQISNRMQVGPRIHFVPQWNEPNSIWDALALAIENGPQRRFTIRESKRVTRGQQALRYYALAGEQ
jgi:hypothetical protein